MSETQSDEDLKKAIALSLMPPKPKPQKSGLISLVSDDEDEDDDLDKPVTAKPISARVSAGKKSPPPMDHTRENVTDSTKGLRILHSAEAVTAPMTSGLLGLNRKQMEHERLVRAACRKRAEQEEGDVSMTDVPSRKRKASTSPTSSQDQLRQIQDMSGDIRESLPKAKMEKEFRPLPDINSARSEEGILNPQRFDNKVFKNRNTQSHERMISSPKTSRVSDVTTEARETPFVAKNTRALKPSSIQYLDGVVKKTWAFGYDRQGDDIKFEEVLQKNDLDLAVLSAFQLDADWVMSKLDAKTKVVWVLQAKDEAQKQNWASGAPKNYRFCFPPMPGNVNCMHSKLQLLAHPTHLRVVVPSANLTPYDWGETGVMENVCFIIDLPRLPDGQETVLEELTHFAKELLLFLEAMGLDRGQINSMRKFDFSRTAHLAFVHSIGGSHTGAQLSTGLCGLSKAIRDLGLSTEGALNIDFLAASIGSLNENFLKSMYLAAQGDDGLTGWCTNRLARGKGAETREGKISEELKSHCRIYFPSRESVEQSKGGTGAGGTICLQSKWYDGTAFPRFLMRDCKSQRVGLLMHSKMIFVRPEKDLRDSVAWVYVGSANLSESAWGRLVKGRGGTTKLNCRNWECGVVIPIPRSMPPAEEAGVSDQLGMSVFKGHVPVPMIVPGEEYGARRPWFYNEQ